MEVVARRVFYSFHYQRDSWRASQVRNIGVVEGNPPASDNAWETVKNGGDAAIRRWIDRQLKGRTCTVVLVGRWTAARWWVKYEIKKTWTDGDKGLLGIRIHGLRNQEGLTSAPGPNPFDQFNLKSGKVLGSRVALHDPPGRNSRERYLWIQANMAAWIEEAVANR